MDPGILTGFDYDPDTSCIYYVNGRVIKRYNLATRTASSMATLGAQMHEFSLNNVAYLRHDNALLINDAYPGQEGGILWCLRLDARALSKAEGRQVLRGKIGEDYALCQDYDSKTFHIYRGETKPVADFGLSKGDYLIGCRCLQEKNTFEVFIWKKLAK